MKLTRIGSNLIILAIASVALWALGGWLVVRWFPAMIGFLNQ
jgi:hypothetical protein